MTERALYTLTLRPEPAGVDKHGRDPEYRLRAALKLLLRSFGLRCVAITPSAAGEPVCGVAVAPEGSDPTEQNKPARADPVPHSERKNDV